MSPDRKIRFALGIAAALCRFAVLPAQAGEDVLPANPPAAPAVTNPGAMTKDELSRFEGFLDQHPNIEARLRENPTLTNNPAFQRNHPLFSQFLARHPELSSELSARPRWFIHRELQRQSAAPITAAQLGEFDHFLDQHPQLERQLLQHPKLLRQPDYLTGHPDLHEFLKRHPGIDRAGESKPERLMKIERRN